MIDLSLNIRQTRQVKEALEHDEDGLDIAAVTENINDVNEDKIN